jgi:hypothetical protein
MAVAPKIQRCGRFYVDHGTPMNRRPTLKRTDVAAWIKMIHESIMRFVLQTNQKKLVRRFQ